MPVEVKLPGLGENVESGDVIKVLVKAGDTIRQDDPLVELETGKATVEVPSTAAGKVLSVHVQPGDKIKVGHVLVTLDGASAVAESKPAAEPQTASAEKPAKSASSAQKAPAKAVPAVAPAAAGPVLGEDDRRAVAAPPSVRQFAREIGVDIAMVHGSGPGGRISVEDVKQFARHRTTAPAAAAMAVPAAVPPLPDFATFGSVRREAMNNIRQMTAQQMAVAWSTIPMVTHHEEADVTDLENLRRQYGPHVEAVGGKLTVTAILLKTVATALRKFPKFNASIDLARREVVFKDYVNIGVAVDTERGLLVPVVRDADRKSIVQLARDLSTIASKARDRKLMPDDLSGGNFTITNLGGLGTHHFTPIVNAPEVAILGVGRAEWKPAVVDGTIKPRLRMPLSLTYDHRLIDGADAARFAKWLVEALEQPFVLSLES